MAAVGGDRRAWETARVDGDDRLARPPFSAIRRYAPVDAESSERCLPSVLGGSRRVRSLERGTAESTPFGSSAWPRSRRSAMARVARAARARGRRLQVPRLLDGRHRPRRLRAQQRPRGLGPSRRARLQEIGRPRRLAVARAGVASPASRRRRRGAQAAFSASAPPPPPPSPRARARAHKLGARGARLLFPIGRRASGWRALLGRGSVELGHRFVRAASGTLAAAHRRRERHVGAATGGDGAERRARWSPAALWRARARAPAPAAPASRAAPAPKPKTVASRTASRATASALLRHGSRSDGRAGVRSAPRLQVGGGAPAVA